MRAINVYVELNVNTETVVSTVDLLNSFKDIAAFMVREDEIFVAATNDEILEFVEYILSKEFGEDFLIKASK